MTEVSCSFIPLISSKTQTDPLSGTDRMSASSVASQLDNDNNDDNTNDDNNDDDADTAVDFARLAGGLKTTPRTGWVRRRVPRYESVADHSWRVAVMSLLLPDDYDISKCMAMGLVHDMAESLTGDICPADNVSKQDKHRMEADAMKRIAGTLNNGKARQLMDLFDEYEKRETKEAIAVKDLDLLDMILQADEYEHRFAMDLGEFFEGTPITRFKTPTLQRLAAQVHDQRNGRKAQEETRDDQDGQDNGTNGKDNKTDATALAKADEAFVQEHAKASSLSASQIEEVVRSLRNWESN